MCYICSADVDIPKPFYNPNIIKRSHLRAVDGPTARITSSGTKSTVHAGWGQVMMSARSPSNDLFIEASKHRRHTSRMCLQLSEVGCCGSCVRSKSDPRHRTHLDALSRLSAVIGLERKPVSLYFSAIKNLWNIPFVRTHL
jgi:hypothetical protein